MKRLIMGAEAIAVAATDAGLESYFGYPITPSSEIMEKLASIYESGKYSRFKVYVQTSSEIETVNMLMGAGASGHIAMTATSGPGLSLMAEGISYSYASEVPFVIIDVNRGGPGLGNVAPEQSDYSFVTKSLGHGGTKVIVLSPSSINESIALVGKSFQLSFKYRTPVVILTDAIIVHMIETVDYNVGTPVVPEAPWAARGRNGGARHLINSIYMEPSELKVIKLGLESKWKAIEGEALSECFMCDDARILFISYGISARVAREAVIRMRGEGMKAGLFRPVTLSPFPENLLKKAAESADRVKVIEMSEGQLAIDVRYWLKREVDVIPFLGGIHPSAQEVIEKCR